MSTYIFGIITGIFLYSVGGLFFKWAIRAFGERKEANRRELIKMLKNEIIDDR